MCHSIQDSVRGAHGHVVQQPTEQHLSKTLQLYKRHKQWGIHLS